jgi:hypothetical protein
LLPPGNAGGSVRHRSLDIDKDNAIACVQYLYTDEQDTPFHRL